MMQWNAARNWKTDWFQAKGEKEYVKTDRVRKFSSLFFLDFFFHGEGKTMKSHQSVSIECYLKTVTHQANTKAKVTVGIFRVKRVL